MAKTYQDRYREALEYLLDKIPADAGTAESTLARAEKRFGLRVPPALRDYYRAVGKLRSFHTAHNRLLAPADWFVDAGRLVFMEENQRVVFWGVATGAKPAEDPPVFQGVNQHPDPIEWHPESDRCSDFLVVMMHWQAVCGGLEWGGLGEADAKILRTLKRSWELVGPQADLTAFRRPGLAACVLSGEEGVQVFVGARTEAGYEKVAAELEAAGVELEPA